jgi:competence protein ComGB
MNDGCLTMKRRKWSIKEQADFLKKTGELLARGYPLSDAIQSLSYQMKKVRQEEIRQFLDDLKEGHQLHKILTDLRFHKTLVGFVYFAEQHGSLSDAFRDGSAMMQKRDTDAEKLKKLLIYPAVLLFMTFFLFLFVESVLLPQYTSLFQSMNISPNIFMRIVNFTGNIFPLIVCFTLLFLFLSINYYFFKFRKLPPIKQRTMIVSIPILGSFYRLLTTHYFTIQLSYLLGGGLSILESLTLFEKHVKQPFDRQLGREMQEQLSTGESFDDILTQYKFFERELPFIVKHGQENGKLDEELLFYSRHCISLLATKTDKCFKIIQPILYSIIGIIIISMYLAILLPMFQLLDGF